MELEGHAWNEGGVPRGGVIPRSGCILFFRLFMARAATISTLGIPAAPVGWAPVTSNSKAISVPKARVLLPVGSAYLAHARRTIHKRTLDQYLEEEEAEGLGSQNPKVDRLDGEDDLGVGDEPESPSLLARDAKEWKVGPLGTPMTYRKSYSFSSRLKTTMLSLVCPSSATRRPKNKLR